jgi:maltose-binding protein MalE
MYRFNVDEKIDDVLKESNVDGIVPQFVYGYPDKMETLALQRSKKLLKNEEMFKEMFVEGLVFFALCFFLFGLC